MDEQQMDVGSAATEAQEASLPMQKVNDLIKRTKIEEAARVQKQLEAKYAAEMEAIKGNQQAPSIDLDSVYGEVEKRLMDKISEHQRKQAEAQEEERLKKLANAYVDSTKRGAEKYQDWAEVTQKFDPRKFPDISLMLGDFGENAEHLLYDLNKRPQTLAAVQLMAERAPEMAQAMLKEISDSIVENQKAKEQHVPSPSPLSRAKSSTVGAGSGSYSIEDFKNAPWLRG